MVRSRSLHRSIIRSPFTFPIPINRTSMHSETSLSREMLRTHLNARMYQVFMVGRVPPASSSDALAILKHASSTIIDEGLRQITKASDSEKFSARKKFVPILQVFLPFLI